MRLECHGTTLTSTSWWRTMAWPAIDVHGRQRMKLRCKLLVKGLQPEMHEKAKAVRTESDGNAQRRVSINGVLEVPFCPDTGSDSNIISRRVVNDLTQVWSPSYWSSQCRFKWQGSRMECCESVTVDLAIETAAGQLYLRNEWCLVMDAEEDEFLLGKRTLREIGIAIDGMFEELASNHALALADHGDLGEDQDVLAIDDDKVIQAALESVLVEAQQEGFDPEYQAALHQVVMEYADVWRLTIGSDEAAKVEPMRVTLRDNGHPYRSPSCKYSEAQRAFLRACVRELEEKGLVSRNNKSRWASAVGNLSKSREPMSTGSQWIIASSTL
jgi:hypothetical protein